MKNSIAQKSAYILLLSCMAIALLAVRVYFTGSIKFAFLIWNLFLAWIQLLATIFIYRFRPQNKSLLVLYFIWLLFFPNAIYILTDFIHLNSNYSFQSWIDLTVLLLFAMSGFFASIISLSAMQQYIVRHSKYHFLAGLHLMIVCIASGYGVYLGRFLRFNSWDMLHHPMTIIYITLQRVAHPMAHLRTFFITLFFSLLLYISHKIFALKA